MSFTDTRGSSQGFVFDPVTVYEKTASYVAVNDDFFGNRTVTMNVGTANTFTVNAGIVGTRPVLIINEGIGLCTITAGAGVTLKSSGDKFRLVERYAMATVIPDPLNTDAFWVVGGLA